MDAETRCFEHSPSWSSGPTSLDKSTKGRLVVTNQRKNSGHMALLGWFWETPNPHLPPGPIFE